MAFTPPPIPPTDLVASEAGPALVRLCSVGVCDSTVNTSRWLRELLHMRARGEVTLRAAVYIVRWILTHPVTGGPQFLWSNAALVECLGQVDARSLGPDPIRKMQSDAYSLALGSLGGNIRTLDVLTRAVAARRSSFLGLYPTDGAAYVAWYDRVREALEPYLRP